MTVPHPLQQMGLFAAQWYQPIDRRTQVTRWPPHDAPCCGAEEPCGYPFCKPPETEESR